MNGTDLLTTTLADELASVMDGAEGGHCVRVDDVNETLAPHLARELKSRMPGVAVHVLRRQPHDAADIAAERAIEIRNRKAEPCLLLVPAGEGYAASSLDNSFRRVPVLEVYDRVETTLMREIKDRRVYDLVVRNRRWLSIRQQEAWAEFLAHLCITPTEETFGRNLWRVGLVPDHGSDAGERLDQNRRAVGAIARPGRPSAALDERFTDAGVEEGSWRSALRAFCERRGPQLANPRLWAREISESRPDLTFDRWPIATAVHEDLDGLEVVPFTNPSGKVETWSKLKQGADGQLVLEIPENGSGSVSVRWKTQPANVSSVAKWHLAVLPPDDLRDADPAPLATTTVAGGQRQGTLKVSLEEDTLESGTRYVVVVTALGDHGGPLALPDGADASADSQEFQITDAEARESKPRKSAAASIAEAALRAAAEGLDDLSEDLVSWDMAGRVFSLRLGNRRSVQVRICELLVRLQHLAIQNHASPTQLSAEGAYGTPIDLEHVTQTELAIPTALRKARSEFLRVVGESEHRNTIESVVWTEELREKVRTYAASYKRALEGSTTPDDLLRMDTITLRVRRGNEVVEGVVVLPTHPLRALWVAEYDRVMRRWAAELCELPNGAGRQRSVDLELAAQVSPANLPFTVVTDAGAAAIYAEELTFGAGLYLVPSDMDSEAAAEAMNSVLDLVRTSVTLGTSAATVAERIGAYEAAHSPGDGMRVLAVNPGSGDLLSAALKQPAASEEDDVEPRRVELIAYTDSTSYTRPVPSLVQLQHTYRNRESRRRTTHLTPPLSLAVRGVRSLDTDETAAHIAVVQDLGRSAVGLGRDPERRASFDDLLVPLVTESHEVNGSLIWHSVAATGPATGGSEAELGVVHRAHQRAVARSFSADSDGVPAVEVSLDVAHQARIAAAHRRADWVIGIDRFIGVDLYEAGTTDQLGGTFILDYAPDFVEGIGDRLTVTTSRRTEVELLLADAMRDLGLGEVQRSVGNVLSTLAVVSGRLALRLLENSNQAREAVSLAALITHLKERDELDGLIIVPVDAHPEIFGVAAREGATAKRCDLLLVRVGQRSFKIECVEVKSRKDARLPQLLAEHIVDQLQDTKRLLESRFFAQDPPRIDQKLQLARLASILHYYADRSVLHGLIEPGKAADVHRYIDRVTDIAETPEISMRGYVVSLEGDEGFKKKYGDVPMTVLTAADLGKVGFTTLVGRPIASTEFQAQPERNTYPANPAAETPTSVEPDPVPSPTIDGPRGREADEASSEIVSESQPLTEANAAALEPEHKPVDDASDEESPEPPAAAPAAPRTATNVDISAEEPAESGRSVVEVELGVDASSSPVTMRVSTQGSPHAFILGIPGQGKSVTTRRIIDSFAAQQLPSLVFDFHGDMAADPPAGATVVNAAEGLPFSPFEADVRVGRPINTTAWEISEIVAYVTKLGEIQRNHVYDALLDIYARRGWTGTTPGSTLPVISELAPALEAAEASSAGKNALQRLRPMTDFGLFRDDASGSLDLLGAYRGGLVVDLSQLGLEQVQMFAASFVLRKIYREMFRWPLDHTMKLAVVLDEAHRMARDVTLPKLMKEGRKYGLSVIVASQNTDDFHRDVLGNAGTKIVFRTNHPASKAVAGFLRGRTGSDLSVEVEKLNVGVAYVSTPDNPQAQKTYMQE